MVQTFIVLGIDHRHAFGMTENLQNAGAICLGFFTEGKPETLRGWNKRFPDIPKIKNLKEALDIQCDFVVVACIPADRAEISIAAMKSGKDVMTDKPGCLTQSQLEEIECTVAETKRIWSINFSERFEVPAATKATELIQNGAIGRVIQTVGLGPHRLNKATRPKWFFNPQLNGGILADIASHQIDQFLFYTGSESAEITMAHTANHAMSDHPNFRDLGELSLKSDKASGYIRVDWFTPDGLPTWGDGRLTLLGTKGYIELRKYVDVATPGEMDKVVLVTNDRCEYIDASDEGLPYFESFLSDVKNRTEKAMSQNHCFNVMRLALIAQSLAET